MNKKELERKIDILWSKLWYINAWDKVVLYGKETGYPAPHHTFVQRAMLLMKYGFLKASLSILNIKKEKK